MGETFQVLSYRSRGKWLAPLLAGLFSAGLLGGCVAQESGAPSLERNAQVNGSTPLEGDWRIPCRQSDWEDPIRPAPFMEIRMKVRGPQLTIRLAYFETPECDGIPAEWTETQELFSLEGPALAPVGATQIDFVQISSRSAAENPLSADWRNHREVCGLKDWTPGEVREVAGLDCRSGGMSRQLTWASGVRSYDIVLLPEVADSESVICFGSTESGATQLARPTQLADLADCFARD